MNDPASKAYTLNLKGFRVPSGKSLGVERFARVVLPARSGQRGTWNAIHLSIAVQPHLRIYIIREIEMMM